MANGRENVSGRPNEIQISDKQPFNKHTDTCTLGRRSLFLFVFKMFRNTFVLYTLPIARTLFNFVLIGDRLLVLQVVEVIENAKRTNVRSLSNVHYLIVRYLVIVRVRRPNQFNSSLPLFTSITKQKATKTFLQFLMKISWNLIILQLPYRTIVNNPAC